MAAPQITLPPINIPDRFDNPATYNAEMIPWVEWQTARAGEETTLGEWTNTTATDVDTKHAQVVIDAAQVAADRVQTGLDRGQTGLDRGQTGLDRGQTAADRVTVGANKTSTTSSKASALTYRDTASLASGEVAALKSKAIAAWAAATYPNETLASISQTIHSGTVIASCIDEVTGDWVDQCQDLSWYKEAATVGCANWLGQRAIGTVTAGVGASEGSARYTIPEVASGGRWSVTGSPTLVAGSGGYYQNDGTINRFLSIPDSALTSVTGDLEIVVKASLTDWTPGALSILASKYSTATAGGYYMTITPSGYVQLNWSTGAVGLLALSTVIPTVADGATLWLKITLDVDNGTAGYSVMFYTSADGLTWAQLGATVTVAGVTSIGDGTHVLAFGASSTGTYPINGKIYYAEIKSGIGGTTVAKFDGSTITANSTNDYFQNSSDNKFYKLNATSGVTEVFRGTGAKYPRRAWWAAEASRVVCYDLASPGCPMWGVWAMGTANAITANNGVVVIGRNTSGMCVFDFGINKVTQFTSSGTREFIQGLASTELHSNFGAVTVGPFYPPAIVNSTVNSVAITVLPNAPIDAATGLPVPTIYAFTAGGVSRIAHDGTVSSTATSTSVLSGWVDSGYAFAMGQSGVVPCSIPVSSVLPTGGAASLSSFWTAKFYATNTIPAILSGNGKGVKQVFGSASGVSILKENPATPSKGMVAYITPTYSTGWMNGDIRGAFLSDKVAETVTGVTVLNDDFSSYADDAALQAAWTSINTCLITLVGGAMRCENGIALGSSAARSFTTVVGKTYSVTAKFSNAAASCRVSIMTGLGTGTYAASTFTTGDRTEVINFTATTATTYIGVGISSATAGLNFTVDDISWKLAEADRSVKNNGLIVNGSITKTALGTSGDSLVAYSGFSATNYFEQPYSANLDFATGDFGALGWVNLSATSGQVLYVRGGGSGAMIAVYVAGGTWRLVCATSEVEIATGATANTGLSLVCLARESGVLKLYINNALAYSAANTANLTNTSAVTRFGNNLLGTAPLTSGSLALWRISATAPSADQIAQIYRDELPLLQGADCVLAGTSAAITAMSYSQNTDVLSVGTSQYRADFKRLQRVNSVAGAVTSLSSAGDTIITNTNIYQPEISLIQPAPKAPVFEDDLFNFDAVTAQTVFTLPKGYMIKAVFAAGLLQRLNTTYTITNDGYQYSATFTVAPGNGVKISIMPERIK